KYQADGVTATLRPWVKVPPFADNGFGMYGVAAHFEWEHEAKLASFYTLKAQIHSHSNVDCLSKMPQKYLIRLYYLHWLRKACFREALYGAFEKGFRCNVCSKRCDLSPIFAVAIAKMEERPLGDTATAYLTTKKFNCYSCQTP